MLILLLFPITCVSSQSAFDRQPAPLTDRWTDHFCQQASPRSAISEMASSWGYSAPEMPDQYIDQYKSSPFQMGNWPGEPIDMFPLKQVACIYHCGGGAWSHLKLLFRCVCACVCRWIAWTDSLPPCGHHNSGLSVIHAGSCSAKWDFPGDYGL